MSWFTILSGKTPATSDITAQVWQTFDFATLSTGNLAANDHTADGSWTLNDSGTKLSMSTSGVKALVSTVNGVSTAGATYGMAMDYNGTATCDAQYNPTSYGANAISYVGAIFVPAFGSDANFEVFWAYNVVHLRYRRISAAYTFDLTSGAGTSSGISVTAGAWYYVAVLAQQNATCRLRVYDASGVQVGSEVTSTGSNAAQTNALFGESNTHTAQTGVFYYANWCINTSGTWPFGP